MEIKSQLSKDNDIEQIKEIENSILQIENMLTKVQSLKAKYINLWNNFNLQCYKYKLDKERVKVYKNKSSLKLNINDLIDREDLQ